MTAGLFVSAIFTAVVGRWAFRKYGSLERRAAQAERLAELGMLTAGLAHEIKNPLSTLQLNLQLLREEVDERAALLASPIGDTAAENRRVLSRMQKRLGTVVREASRLREILDDFLRYAGRIEPERRLVDLAELAGELADFLSPQVQLAKLKFETDFAPVKANVDPGLIKQALLNLLLNAIQHTPDGGTVRLSISPERRKRGGDGPPGDSGVRLTVSDTGKGIAGDQRDRVFDPYFTRRKGGTGLGLALTRRIAEAHNGRIELESEVGRGSKFSLIVPA